MPHNMLGWFRSPSPAGKLKGGGGSRAAQLKLDPLPPPRQRLSFDEVGLAARPREQDPTAGAPTAQEGSAGDRDQAGAQEAAEDSGANKLALSFAAVSLNGGSALSAPYCRTLTITHDPQGRKLVNQYLKERFLGTGSYCKVTLYKDTISGHFVAIKTASKSRLRRIRIFGQETAFCDVKREIKILHGYHHPNIIGLVEAIDVEATDKLYIVLEYASRGPLFTGTGPEGGIGEDRARKCMRDIVPALQHLHRTGVIHGDVKPDNILVLHTGTHKLADFSASTILQPGEQEIRRSPGTLVFSAPECCSGHPFNGEKADTWALGCTLYLCVCGKYPFFGTTMEATFQEILGSEPLLPDTLSEALKDLLRRLLEKDPKQRMTLEEMAGHDWLCH